MTLRNDATRLAIPLRDPRRPRMVVPRQGQVLLDTDIAGISALTLDRVEIADADMIGAPGRLAVPAAAPGFAVSAVSLAGGKVDCTVGAGRGYLGGWLVENPAEFTLSATSGAKIQPHPWASPAAVPPVVIGLKAVVRLVDPVEDSALADRALGDAQASGRALVDWQAFALPVAAPVPLACADVLALPAWQALIAPSSAKLQFIKAQPPASTDPCSLSESGGYTRLENLLYRVEVHRGVLADDAPPVGIDGPRYKLEGVQLKLSRSNASVLARIDKIDGRIFKVSPAALDPRAWFAEGQLAELVSIHDDVDTAAAHATERLFRVARVTDDEVELVDRSGTDSVAKVAAVADGSWFLRMWECLPDAAEVAVVALDASGTHSTVINLGDGIAIQLAGAASARLRRGDYWTCAMRADGTIEWSDGAFSLPQGAERRYAPLAAINAGPAVEDCRIAIASLADRQLLYRGGDGQEAMPDPTKPAQRVPLASKLRIAVMRGEHPVAGARVDFAVKDLPAGKTAQLVWQPPAGPSASGTTIAATTGPDGLAEVAWEIDPTVKTQRVEARLVPAAAMPAQPPLLFTANLSLASATGFDPKAIPIFAGITDVQRALEAVAGMQQAGCATYVLTPQNWLDVLQGLKPKEDAKLCFQRGEFKAEKRVELTGLGHLSLCGAGEGTRLVVSTGECVLAFTECVSVHVAHLAADSPDGAQPNARGPHVTGRGGTLTFIDCPDVTVEDCALSCAGQAVTERTCLTIRGSDGRKDGNTERPSRPLDRVRVTGNRFTVGFAQDGVLVTEARDCLIHDNILVAAPLPEGVDKRRVILSRTFRDAMMRALVPADAIRKGPTPPADDGRSRFLAAGKLRASFVSDVPQSVWDKLAAAHPPTEADTASTEAFASYAGKLFHTAAADTGLVRKFAPDVLRAERDGATEFTPAVRAAFLRKGAIRVSDAGAAPAAPANAAAAAPGTGAASLSSVSVAGLAKFPSVLGEGAWQTLLDRVPIGSTVVTPKGVREHLEKAARVALTDAKLRDRIAGMRKWFDGQVEALGAWARQAITVGGNHVGHCVISGNRMTGFAQAVHVGASTHSARQETVSFASVTVTGNIAQLFTQGDLVYSIAGIFVGNAETIRIENNVLDPVPGAKQVFVRSAIRVWGRLGHFLVVEKNRLGVGKFGVCIRSIDNFDSEIRGMMWLVADNVGIVQASSDLLRIPSWVEKRYNRA